MNLCHGCTKVKYGTPLFIRIIILQRKEKQKLIIQNFLNIEISFGYGKTDLITNNNKTTHHSLLKSL